ncbi:hypothetical protein [Streptomyces sp. NPDC051569]|uniref:hypothetical protein n=1 Tax=Streptomyces sp. NPDC051569 TaxID=3365661 RepID=UPI0037976752
MLTESSPRNPPNTLDVDQVLKQNYIILAKFIAVRVAIIAALFALPIVLQKLGVPESFFLALLMVPPMYVFIFTLYRVRYGVRITQCARVMRLYPLEFHTRVVYKRTEWTEYGNVFTIRASIRGQHGAPSMLALNAAGRRRWPEGIENGAWIAGDLPFGGVLVVPGSNAMMFLNPADWEKMAPRREQAGAERIARAEQAKLAKRNWKKPVFARVG